MAVKAKKIIAIDIGTTSVKLLRTNGAGIAKAVSSVDWPAASIADGAQEAVNIMASALKTCAKKGKIGKGKCVLLIGGPSVILRNFTWPKMPADALYENALFEISSYLSRPVETYVVDYKILRDEDENNQNVLVCAVDRDYIVNIIAACGKAGFKPVRIDLRENVREKLAHADFIWHNRKKSMPDFDADASYAFVDVGPELSSVTVFTDGTYSVNRYITSLNAKMDDIVSEIGSVINYASYSNRKSKASSVIMLRDGASDMASLCTRLSEDIELPVNKAAPYLSEFFSMEMRLAAKPAAFADAFAATLQVSGNALKDFNLIPRKKKRYLFKRVVLPVFLTLLFIAAGLSAGIYFPDQKKQALAAQLSELDAQAAALETISQDDLDDLSRRVAANKELSADFNNIFGGPIDMPAVLNAVVSVLPSDAEVTSLSNTDSALELVGTAPTAAVVAELWNNLHKIRIFSDVRVESVQEVTTFVTGANNASAALVADKHVTFTIRLELNTGSSGRNGG